MNNMTTWRKLAEEEFRFNRETWDDVIYSTIPDHRYDVEFDGGFGADKGEFFMFWTLENVYFAHYYDGEESVYSMPRNPPDE